MARKRGLKNTPYESVQPNLETANNEVHVSGYRVSASFVEFSFLNVIPSDSTRATTLNEREVASAAFPFKKLFESLYSRRWNVEQHFRERKVTFPNLQKEHPSDFVQVLAEMLCDLGWTSTLS